MQRLRTVASLDVSAVAEHHAMPAALLFFVVIGGGGCVQNVKCGKIQKNNYLHTVEYAVQSTFEDMLLII